MLQDPIQAIEIQPEHIKFQKLEGVDLVGGSMALLSEVCARGGHVRQATVRKLLSRAYAEPVCCAVQADPRERFADARYFFESFVLNAPAKSRLGTC